MEKYDELSKSLYWFGISIGFLAGIMASFVSRTELSYALSLGIPGGYTTAAITTIVIS